MSATKKALVQERVEHRDAHLWLQLKQSLGLRRRHAEVWVIAVTVADALQMIVKWRHGFRLVALAPLGPAYRPLPTL
jgi:hypothetical protein